MLGILKKYILHHKHSKNESKINTMGTIIDYFVFKKMQYHCFLQLALRVNCLY